ncbi:MAG: hypothetical protein ACE5JF_02700 [Anaerolineales bacterium]
MTSLREAVRRLLSRTQDAAPPDPEYSYTIYWTKTVFVWDDARRKNAREAVEHLIEQPEFVPTAFERRYHNTYIDDSKHSGESLLALHKVLKAFERESTLSPGSSGV